MKAKNTKAQAAKLHFAIYLLNRWVTKSKKPGNLAFSSYLQMETSLFKSLFDICLNSGKIVFGLPIYHEEAQITYLCRMHMKATTFVLLSSLSSLTNMKKQEREWVKIWRTKCFLFFWLAEGCRWFNFLGFATLQKCECRCGNGRCFQVQLRQMPFLLRPM